MNYEIVNPGSLGVPRGWNNGMLGPAGGRVLFVAGQTAASGGAEPAGGFVEQFGQALGHVLDVVRAAGGAPGQIGRFTIFVTDMETYRASGKALGEVYRKHMGKHFPAMALVEVRALVDPRALVEIEATAIL